MFLEDRLDSFFSTIPRWLSEGNLGIANVPSVIFECVFLRCREDPTKRKVKQREEWKRSWCEHLRADQPGNECAGGKGKTREIVATSEKYQCVQAIG